MGRCTVTLLFKTIGFVLATSGCAIAEFSDAWQLDRIVDDSIYVAAHETITLPCDTIPKVSKLIGRLTFIWYKDGVTIDDIHIGIPGSKREGYTLDLSRGDLTIYNFNKRSKAGRYMCRVTNPKGSLLGWPTQLKLARGLGPARGVLDADDNTVVVVQEGNSARLSCYQPSFLPAAEYHWNAWPKPGDPSAFLGTITEHPEYGKRLFALPYGVLQIVNATEDLMRKFECSASNVVDHKYRMFDLRLASAGNRTAFDESVAPDVIMGPRTKVYAAVGSNAVLECGVSGSPQYQLKSFTKRRSGNSSLVVSPRLPPVEGRYFLNITSVGLEHSGSYRCVVGSPSNGTYMTKKLKLTVYKPPTLSGKVFEYVTVPPGSFTVLKCGVKSETTLTFSWFFNGEKLNTTKKKHSVSKSSVKARGFFQCFVTNGAGTVRKTFQIKIAKPTAPPLPVRIIGGETTASTITFRWHTMDYSRNNAMKLVAFTLTLYKPAALPTHEVVVVSNQCETCEPGQVEEETPEGARCLVCTYTYRNMEADTSYNITVLGYSTSTYGNCSQMMTFTTKPVVPLLPPANQSHELLGSSALIIKWSAVPPNGSRGKIVSYRITYRRYQAGDIRYEEVVSVTVPEKERFYVVAYTKPGELYQYRVVGATIAGFSRSDEIINPWKVAAIPVDAVYTVPAPEFTLSVNNDSHVKVTLTPNLSQFGRVVLCTSARGSTSTTNQTAPVAFFPHNMSADGWIDVTIAYYNRTTVEHSAFITRTLGVNCQKAVPSELAGTPRVTRKGFLAAFFHWRHHQKCPTVFFLGYQRVYKDGSLGMEVFESTTDMYFNFTNVVAVRELTDFPVSYMFRVVTVRGTGNSPAQSNVLEVTWHRAPEPQLHRVSGGPPLELAVWTKPSDLPTIPNVDLLNTLSIKLRYQEVVFPGESGVSRECDKASAGGQRYLSPEVASTAQPRGRPFNYSAPGTPNFTFVLDRMDISLGKRYKIVITVVSDFLIDSQPLMAFTSAWCEPSSTTSTTTVPSIGHGDGDNDESDRGGDTNINNEDNESPKGNSPTGLLLKGVSQQTMGIVIGVALAVLFIFLCLAVVVYLRKRAAQRQHEDKKRCETWLHQTAARGSSNSSSGGVGRSAHNAGGVSYVGGGSVGLASIGGGLGRHRQREPARIYGGGNIIREENNEEMMELHGMLKSCQTDGYESDGKESEKDSLYSSDKVSSSSKNTFERCDQEDLDLPQQHLLSGYSHTEGNHSSGIEASSENDHTLRR